MFCRISEDHLNGPGSLADRLRALPAFTPPAGGWNNLSARMQAKRRRVAVLGTGLALAASVVVAVSVTLLRPVPQSAAPANLAAAATPEAVEVAQLITRSQALERELSTAKPQVVVWTSGRETRAAVLEQRMRMIDAQLNEPRSDSAERLWRERVKTMNALVQLHKPQEPALQYASYQY